MDFGIKLTTKDFFDKEPSPVIEAQDEFLSRIKTAGIDFAEIQYNDSVSWEDIYSLVGRCAEHDLYASLHPYPSKNLRAEAFTETEFSDFLTEFLDTVVAVKGITGYPVRLTFHGGEANGNPCNQNLADATAHAKEFVAWMVNKVETDYPDILLFFETQIPAGLGNEEMVRLGDTFDSLLDLAEGTDARFTWDFGHSFVSSRINKQALQPPAEFLSRVGHVHAHDVVEIEKAKFGLRDHRPLGTGICPWKEYCQLLGGAGFDETIEFELPLDVFTNIEEYEKMIAGATRDIRAIISTSDKDPVRV